VAIVGSLATTAYHSDIRTALAGPLRGLSAGARQAVGSQIGDAVGVARTLPPGLDRATKEAANHAFVSGLHLAALVGVGVMIVSTLAAARYVPARVAEVDDKDTHVFGAPVAGKPPPGSAPGALAFGTHDERSRSAAQPIPPP
jgi:DHA2 family multidrug resistance protein-like MFS transporter